LAALSSDEEIETGDDSDEHIVFGALGPSQSVSVNPTSAVPPKLECRHSDVDERKVREPRRPSGALAEHVDALQHENDMLRQEIERINQRKQHFQERLSKPVIRVPPPLQELTYPCASYAHCPCVPCGVCYPSLNPSVPPMSPMMSLPEQSGEQVLFQGSHNVYDPDANWNFRLGHSAEPSSGFPMQSDMTILAPAFPSFPWTTHSDSFSQSVDSFMTRNGPTMAAIERFEPTHLRGAASADGNYGMRMQ